MSQSGTNRIFISLVVGALVCVGLLLFQASQTGVSDVLLPSDLAAEGVSDRARLRVAGRVAADTIAYRVEPDFLLEFSIHDPGNETEPIIPVSYRGIKPDMFAAGRDVILDGEWTSGRFVATKLMTQCPSKYEPPKPGPASATVEAKTRS
jgi:cytochrome c-type biogenesis protein CcmE